MSPLNTAKIQTLIGECRKAIAQLSSYATAPRNGILASPEKLGNLKYQFIIAVEAAIDMCQHIAAKGFNEVPESYANCFDVLHTKSIIDAELSAGMSELARFRNVLVHLYWKVEDEKVLDMLLKLPTIERYLQRIAHYCGLI
jgi:uncharacterized protein YutE (UPF0331/DUF86 family)